MEVELLEKPAAGGSGELVKYCRVCGHPEEEHPTDVWAAIEPCMVSGCRCPGWEE